MSGILIRYYDNCPICGKELENNDENGVKRFQCSHKCYELMEGKIRRKLCIISVFSNKTSFLQDNYSDLDKQRLENEVIRNINYWKENDRYLMKILEES